MYLLLHLILIHSSVHFFNTNIAENLKNIDETVKIVCLNKVSPDIKNDSIVEFKDEEIIEFLYSIYETDRKRFQKIIFFEDASNFDIKEYESCVVIYRAFNINAKVKDKELLVAAGCSHDVMKLEEYYFCKCPITKCGITCLKEKPNTFLNISIIILIFLIGLTYRKKKEESEIIVKYADKEKIN